MRRRIWVFNGRTCHCVGFVMLWFKLNMERIAIFESVSLPNIRPPGSNLPVLQLLHCHGNFTRDECRFQKYRIRLHIFNNDQVRNKTIWSRKTFSDSRPIYQLLFIRDALMVPGKKYHNRMIVDPSSIQTLIYRHLHLHPHPALPSITKTCAYNNKSKYFTIGKWGPKLRLNALPTKW